MEVLKNVFNEWSFVVVVYIVCDVVFFFFGYFGLLYFDLDYVMLSIEVGVLFLNGSWVWKVSFKMFKCDFEVDLCILNLVCMRCGGCGVY